MAATAGDGVKPESASAISGSPVAGAAEGVAGAAGAVPAPNPAAAASTEAAPGAAVAPATPEVVALAIPPVAVPTVRAAPKSMKGQTTASDYVAPRELPMSATPKPSDGVDAKVVLDVPDAPKVGVDAAPREGEVAEIRQRRRAPTLKIDRTAIKEFKQIEDGFVVQDPIARGDARSARGPNSIPTGLAAGSGRALARPAPERPSSGGAAWAVAAAAVILIAGGVVAVGTGMVPGLGGEEPASAGAVPTTPLAAPTAVPAAPTVSPSVEPVPSAEALLAPGPPPVESAAVASAAPSAPSAPTVPAPGAPTAPTYRPPAQGARPPAAPPAGGAPTPPSYPRPRPKSDIPTGI